MDISTDTWIVISVLTFWVWIGVKVMGEQLRNVIYNKGDFFELRYERVVWGMLFGVVFWPMFAFDDRRLAKMGK